MVLRSLVFGACLCWIGLVGNCASSSSVSTRWKLSSYSDFLTFVAAMPDPLLLSLQTYLTSLSHRRGAILSSPVPFGHVMESHRRERAAFTPWGLTQPLEKRNSFSNSPAPPPRPSCLPLYCSKKEVPPGSELLLPKSAVPLWGPDLSLPHPSHPLTSPIPHTQPQLPAPNLHTTWG